MLRHLGLLLIVVAASSAAAAAETGDVIVDWYAWSRFGVNVVDPAGNLKPDVVEFPYDPVPDASKFPSAGYWELWHVRTVPMRSGDRLIFAPHTPAPPVARYDASGEIVAIHTLPYEAGVFGATSIELFSDQCTLAWTILPDWEVLTSARRNAIRRFDLCTNKPAGDVLLVPEPDKVPRFVRQLSNGDLLVVTVPVWPDARVTSEILRYSPSGNLVASFSNPLQGRLVDLRLTPDGNGFWVSDDLHLVRFDLANPHEPVVDAQPLKWDVQHQEPPMIQKLSVVGEWRASLQPPPRRRAVRR
jgi:hypothetical protein